MVITLWIAEFLDFIHCPAFLTAETEPLFETLCSFRTPDYFEKRIIEICILHFLSVFYVMGGLRVLQV
jgi:hypothetical protein